MNSKLCGVFPAFMTAFTSDNSSVDTEKTKLLVKKFKKSGVHGLYVGGSSGEMVLCTLEERMKLLETVMEEKGEMAIIAHVGAMSTDEAVKLTRHANSVGVDAISSVTPLYYKYSFEDIKQYYLRLCEVSNVPIIIYSIPALSGTALTFEQLSDLLSNPKIAGMKFTSSDFFMLNRLKSEFPDKIFYNGFDEMLLSGLAAGADGGIGTTYNFMPEKFLEIYNCFKANDLSGAFKTQSLVNRIIACIIKNGVLPSSKYMLALSGFDIGICREPFMPLTEESKADLYENAWKLLQS